MKGRFRSIPDYFIDFPSLYRKDLWTEIAGMPNGPDSWNDLLVGGRKLKAKGHPTGIGLAHHNAEHLTDNFKEAFRAGTGYNNPFPRTFAKGPLPIISEDPKLKVLERSPEYHVTTGYPGPVTQAADEVYQQFVMIDAVAQLCSGMDIAQTVKWADDKLKGIYAKFA